MKVALRYVLLVSSFVLGTHLWAQTPGIEQVNLAVVGEINITLNANCQDSLILSEVIAGDFDVDGNGIIPADNDFQIIVEDTDQTNGPIIDGCGTFSFRVEASGNIEGFTTGWGVVNAEDKTSPFFTANPVAPEGPLYCNAIDDIEINSLAANISRCYRVFTATGNIVPNSLDAALRDRLIAGGGFPTATDNCADELEICVNDIIEYDPIDPQCNDVTLTRTFTVTDDGCPNISGEPNAPGVTSYSITFTRPELSDLDASNVLPEVEIECDELTSLGLSFGDVPAPRQQDLPFFNGPDGTTLPLGLGQGGSFCNIGVTFEDSPLIETCDLAYKVVRTFTLIDWCNPTAVETYTQIVKVGDFSAPEFTAPTQDNDFDGQPDAGGLQFQTNAGNFCGAYLRLDQGNIALTDVCSSNLSLTASIYPDGDLGAVPFGAYEVNLNDNSAEITGLIPVGSHLLRYTYSDECGNAGFTDVNITITDGTSPVAICEDGLNVSLTAGVTEGGTSSLGLAVITPSMIDRNSFDDCSDVSLAIGQVQENADGSFGLVPGTNYGSRLDLTCEDLGTVLVGLEVTDALDNRNYCWLSVLVEDKQDPTCIPPAQVNLTCTQFDELGFPADITAVDDSELNVVFGQVVSLDNCSATVSQSISGSINSCGQGQFQRNFFLEDPSGNTTTCSQNITVRTVFDYTISFPGDTDAICLGTPEIADVITSEGVCDLLIKDVSVDTFQSQADECYLLRVNHLVINFCEYNTLGEPYLIRRDADGNGDFTERVFVHLLPGDPTTTSDDVAILDNDGIRTNETTILFPFIPVDDGNDDDGSDDQNDNDSEDSQAPNGVGFAYAQDNSRGAFLYHQFIAVYDEVAPDLTVVEPTVCFGAQSLNCTGDVTLNFSATDACTAPSQMDLRVELNENYVAANGFNRDRFLLESEFSQDGAGNYTISLTNVPVGDHAVRIRAADGCGNVDVRTLEFCVTDDKAPTPICTGQLTVTLMPNGDGTGNAAVWATDFIASDVEDCSGEVTYSIYTERDAVAPDFTPAPGVNGIILDCESDATTPVRIYAFDPTGLNDYCSVFVLVQRADNACVTENTGAIGGLILSENGEVFANVAVGLDGSEVNVNTFTGTDGRFLFPGLRLGDDYTSHPSLDDFINHSQGVSTFDLVLITQHILGTAPLTSPYQLLAADANNDQEVTVQDLIAIRRLILGYDDAFPNNTGYRFVDANFIFPLNNNPWATSFPEVVNTNNLSGNVFDADFVGIMVGDVNGDGLDNLAGDSGRPRFGAVDLIVEDVYLANGQAYTVDILPGAATTLKGLQGTITAGDGVSITGVDAGQFRQADFNLSFAERGQIAFSYSEAQGLAPEQPLITLHLTAERDGLLSDLLSLSDDQVFTEGYTANDQLVNLALDFGTTEAPIAASINNYPNPMGAQTTISYTLPEAGTASFTLRDLNGRLIFSRNLMVSSGDNQFTLQRRELPGAGVYTYTLITGKTTLSRKLVVK